VFQIVVTILGIAISALYVGYLAYAIKSVPLWVIVILTFALVVREFAVEFRSDSNARGRNKRSRSSTK
jgi:predicted membrane metal-binding protein